MITFEASLVIVALPRLVAGLAYPAPYSPDWLMLCRSGQLHLVHGVFLAEKLPAMPAVDVPVHAGQPFSAHGLGADIIGSRGLPMFLGNDFIRIRWRGPGRGRRRVKGVASLRPGGRWRRALVIRLEDIKAFELLIENGERLEPFSLDHLRLEPVFDFVLSFVLEILMGII